MNVIRAMAVAVGLASCLATPAGADVVIDWSEKAVAAGYAARSGNSAHARGMAIVHIAMFEAVNSIEPRYAPYRARLPAEPGSSAVAAAAAAAHHALVRLYPAQAKEFDKALETTLAGVPDGPARTNGVALGERAASTMLGERSGDGSGGPDTYRPFTAAGRYVPTALPLFSGWGAVRPFGLASGSAVRPPPPPALASAQWASDFDEVRRKGAKNGSIRTPEQTDIARFWTLSGPATYMPVVRQFAAAKRLDLVDNARLFALIAIATADAGVAVFDAKYTFGFWRPLTAIRNGDIDGNDATQRDAAWEPFIATPMHPEYPCAHCIFQSSAATVLQGLFGDSGISFSMVSTTAPGVTRTFERLSDYVLEVIDARILEGVHYRTSGEVGAAMGRRIGEHTLQTILTPLR